MTHILPWEKQQKIIVKLKYNGYIIKQIFFSYKVIVTCFIRIVARIIVT